MEQQKNYYDVLGVSKDATDQEIKTAFRKLARKYHPDRNKNDETAKKKFEEINEAYEVLSNKEKRKNYDNYGNPDGNPFANAAGAEGFSGNPFSGFSGFGNGTGGYSRTYRSPNGGTTYYYSSSGDGADSFGNGFEGFGGSGFEDMFDDLFGHSSGQRQRYSGRTAAAEDEKGADAHAEITIGFDEAAFGADRVVTLTGQDGRQQKLQIHIPAGIEEGKSIRLKGQGSPSPMSGGESGDLYLKVHIAERPGFTRSGADVYTTVMVPFPTAALGGEVKIETLNGSVICKVRPGTQSGSKIRLRGKGASVLGKPGEYGDLYVEVRIEVPENLTMEQKRLIRELADTMKR
jgi:molecular chaperone DnaJ